MDMHVTTKTSQCPDYLNNHNNYCYNCLKRKTFFQYGKKFQFLSPSPAMTYGLEFHYDQLYSSGKTNYSIHLAQIFGNTPTDCETLNLLLMGLVDSGLFQKSRVNNPLFESVNLQFFLKIMIFWGSVKLYGSIGPHPCLTTLSVWTVSSTFKRSYLRKAGGDGGNT